MKPFLLSALPRSITGKKVKSLRKTGIIPATVYGKDFTSIPISLQKKDLDDVWTKAGETHVIELDVSGQKHPVLIHHIQRHPVNENALHVEFRRVNLKEKTQATVPIEVVGESPIVQSGEGILLQLLNEVDVEALPQDIPDAVPVDVSALTQVNQDIKVADLPKTTGATILTSGSVSVVKIGAPVQEEPEPVVVAPEAVGTKEAPVPEEATPTTEEGGSPETQKE